MQSDFIRRCQYEGCNKMAICRVRVDAWMDADSCEEHAKDMIIHYHWSYEKCENSTSTSSGEKPV